MPDPNAGDGLIAVERTADPTRFRWQPPSTALTPGGTLQGGAGLGAAAAAMEAATQRPIVWATAQYLSFLAGAKPIDIDVTVEVAGHNTTQARCVIECEGREILTAHAALGQRSTTHDGVWTQRPNGVAPPLDCEPFRYFTRGQGHLGDLIELRLAHGRQLDELNETSRPGSGEFSLWMRAWTGAHAVAVADLAFLGDMMPLAFADALGAPYAGNSLDNTIRVGTLTTTDWVLMTVHIRQVVNGFGYGHAELWANDGTLLGEVSQSVVLRPYKLLRGANPEESS